MIRTCRLSDAKDTKMGQTVYKQLKSNLLILMVACTPSAPLLPHFPNAPATAYRDSRPLRLRKYL